ncbi:putative FAD-binding domain, FAD/NAD(P)-binding domain superfamily [Septoria linicola]|nr:putative FAD-binding domain, FAD/NAD(P)-binding domain superfamily [Septoria linicola]
MASSRTTSCPLAIVVVGAGMSGLATAISCALAGHQVVVLEGSRELAEIGAGFQITPNGSKVFKQFGIADRLEATAAEPTFLQVKRWSNGKILSRTENFDQQMRGKYNAPFWDLHRVDVQRALAERARELSVEIRLGARVNDVDFEHAKVTLKDGDVLHGDLIVGADGLWSKCRQRYLATQGKTEDAPLPTGDLAYRIVLDIKDVQDQEIRDIIEKPSAQFWIGPEAHVVAYSIRGGTMSNIVLLVPDNLPANVAKQEGSVDEMRAIFKDWDPILNRFLDHVTTIDKWKLMHRPELGSWVSAKSNFVFVGDACHPMLPYLAQGANSSIEDGAVLGGILGALERKEQLPAALKLYEQLRKKRGEAIVRETFAQRADFHMIDGPEQEQRDELMLSQLGKDIDVKFPSRWQCPQVQPWLYGYDAKEEVENALKAHPLSG